MHGCEWVCVGIHGCAQVCLGWNFRIPNNSQLFQFGSWFLVTFETTFCSNYIWNFYIHKYILGGFNQLLLTCILPNLILFRVLHPTIIYGKHRNLTAEKYVCLELGKSWLDDKIICGKALKAESKSNHIWQHWNSLNKYLKTCLTIQTNTNVLCKI